MRLLADANMPLVAELAAQLVAAGEQLTVTQYESRQPTAAQLDAVDLLMIRSVTQIDTNLLSQAPHLKWVGSATIGTEHVDQPACAQHGVQFTHTPGVNAAAVGDYVCSAVAAHTLLLDAPLAGEVAIVGAGHTGQAAAQRLQGLGYQVHYYDPPLYEQGRTDVHADWQRVLNSAAISCHVPLTNSGRYATHHLFDADTIEQLPPGCLLINASRGAVVAEQGLREAMQRAQELYVVLDVWEHEPNIAADLLPWLRFATAHIAGHSMAGKVGGTLALFKAIQPYLQQPHHYPCLTELLQHWPAVIQPHVFYEDEAPDWRTLASWVLAIYDIRVDDYKLRSQPTTAQAFDQIRRKYAHRAELSTTLISGGEWRFEEAWQTRLQQLTFTIE